MSAVVLAQVRADDEAEFLAAVSRSRRLHRPWVAPPDTSRAFHDYLSRSSGERHLGYVVRTADGQLAGVINLSEIVRGAFQSAYLGYYAFIPHARTGVMTRGMTLLLSEAFGRHGLHRVEANIQPRNLASRALVQRLGFELEGLSPRYLKIAGRWRDHERWALRAENWKPRRAELD